MRRLHLAIFLFLASIPILRAQVRNLDEYYDPSLFHSLKADVRSEDRHARAISVQTDEFGGGMVLVQILSPDGKSLNTTTIPWKVDASIIECVGIHSIEAEDGSVMYLFLYAESGGHGGWYWNSDSAVTYVPGRNGGLKPLATFKSAKGDRRERIDCRWRDNDLIDQGVFADFEDDRIRGISFNPENKTLFIPLVEKVDDEKQAATNRFLIYRFEEKDFVYKGVSPAPWLHSSLKDYRKTIACFRAGPHLVQIDALKDGTFRYAIWNNTSTLKAMRYKPSLLLGNGTFHARDGYVFKNEGYVYTVDLSQKTLTVKKNRTVVASFDIVQ